MALIAVIVAFLVGMLATLAIRPPGAQTANVANTEERAVATLRWRVPVAFATTLEVLGDNVRWVTDAIDRASNGAMILDPFEPGEIVPAFNIVDAVREGKVQAGYTWLGYDQGKIPASPLLGAVPFGMEPWEYTAWWYEWGGRELGQDLYAKYGVHPVLCGLIGPETAGWFRTPIDDLADLEGLKIRFAGLGGRVIERLGASVTMLPGGRDLPSAREGRHRRHRVLAAERRRGAGLRPDRQAQLLPRLAPDLHRGPLGGERRGVAAPLGPRTGGHRHGLHSRRDAQPGQVGSEARPNPRRLRGQRLSPRSACPSPSCANSTG